MTFIYLLIPQSFRKHLIDPIRSLCSYKINYWCATFSYLFRNRLGIAGSVFRMYEQIQTQFHKCKFTVLKLSYSKCVTGVRLFKWWKCIQILQKHLSSQLCLVTFFPLLLQINVFRNGGWSVNCRGYLSRFKGYLESSRIILWSGSWLLKSFDALMLSPTLVSSWW